MSDEVPDDAEVTAYVAGRWPVVVRTLVLLGAPPRHAALLATEATSRLLDRSDDDQWVDLDAALAAEVVEAWEGDRTPWWRRPEARVDVDLAGTGVPEALDVLDALTPGERTRLVVRAAVGLTPDQVDDVLGPAGPARLPVGWADDLARVAQAIPVGEARLDAARRRCADRRRDHRELTITGCVVALLVLVAVATTGLVASGRSPEPSAQPVAAAADDTRPAAEPALEAVPTGPDLLPVAWYDGRRVHLADRTVRVPRVRAMARVGDGVVVTDRGGLVLHVRSGGAVERLGRTVPGQAAAAEPTRSTAAWIDAASGALVVQEIGGMRGSVALPAGSRVVAADGRSVYVQQPDGPRRVTVPSLIAGRAGLAVLDAASGVLVRPMGRDMVGVEVTRGSFVVVPGRDGWLSDDGLFLITRDVGTATAPPSVVLDVAAGTSVDLPLPAGSVVADAAFDTEGRVTFAVVRPFGTEYPADWPRDQAYRPGYDLVVCDLGEGRCQKSAQLFSGSQPLLAR